MKLYKQARKYGAKVALATGTALATSPAFAAVPASVTAGIGEAVADVGVIGALVLGVVIAVVGFVWIRKPIR